MTDFLVSKDKAVFKTPLFILSILIPVLISIAFGTNIIAVDNLSLELFGGKNTLDIFWDYMKVPVAIASLSIPLASWVISNHRSAQIVETIKNQEIKQLYDSYYDHSEYFVKTVGRFTTTHKWLYIEKDDLYLIHRQLYHWNLEEDERNNSLKENSVVLDSIVKFCSAISDSLIVFHQNLGYKIATGDVDSANHICMTYNLGLQQAIMELVKNLGSKPVEKDSSFDVLLSAAVEVSALYVWLIPEDKRHPEFKEISHEYVNDIAQLIKSVLGVMDAKDMTPTTMRANEIIRSIHNNEHAFNKSIQPTAFGGG